MSRNSEVILLGRKGLTYQAIGDRYGITRERVRQILNQAGVTEERKAEKERRDAELIALCEEGLTYQAIADKCGLTQDQVYTRVRTIRRRKTNDRRKKPMVHNTRSAGAERRCGRITRRGRTS
jgi:DNA-binding CsgD family transcriptional regulator